MPKIFFRTTLVASLACFVLSGFFIWQRHAPIQAVANTATGLPKTISFPSLGLILPVIPTENGTTPKGVSYVTSTPLPGTPGNSVFYGHNWPNLLGKLHTLVPGQEVHISFSDSKLVKFRIISTSIVDSDQTAVIKQTTDARITVYTCIGLFDSKRFILVAQPI